MSAEYILSGGNRNVMLCERGIRTFETATRNTLDINAIAVFKQWTHLPVFADPSHATGKWELIPPTAKACIAAGADGLIVEVHPHPAQALSDGAQSLKPEKFAELVKELRCSRPRWEGCCDVRSGRTFDIEHESNVARFTCQRADGMNLPNTVASSGWSDGRVAGAGAAGACGWIGDRGRSRAATLDAAEDWRDRRRHGPDGGCRGGDR